MRKNSHIPAHVKQMLQRERRQMARRAAKQAESELDDARQMLSHAAYKALQRSERVNAEAIISGLRAMVTTVSRSWGVSAPIFIETNYWQHDVSASTDFHSVRILYPHKAIPESSEVGKFDVPLLKNLVSDIKGLTYHEVGHLRFTTPFPVLCDITQKTLYTQDQRMHRAWNTLEDQRMETAVVAESPVIAKYFTIMVARWILRQAQASGVSQIPAEQFLLTAGRRYLPSKFRIDMRKAFAAKHGMDATIEAETIIADYKRATTPLEMIEAVARFDVLLRKLRQDSPTGMDSHNMWSSNHRNADHDKEQQRIQESADKQEGDEQEQEQEQEAMGSAPSDQPTDEAPAEDKVAPDGDDEGDTPSAADTPKQPQPQPQSDESSDDKGDQPSDADTPGKGSDASDLPSPDTRQDDLNDLIEDLREQIDPALNETVKDIHERAYGNKGTLPKYGNVIPQSEDWKTQAESLVSTLAESLAVYTAEVSPIWQSRQSRGVVDTFAYRTRPSGSNEYRRLYDTSGDTGIDIAVTVMFDISGSMEGSGAALGAAAYACKAACDSVDIPCSVGVFDSNGRILWDKDDAPEHLTLNCDGGTNPTELFEVLDEQTYGKNKHLVILMTDGQFGFKGCNYYRGEGNRYFVALGYGHDVSVESLNRAEFDSVSKISNLMQVPQVLGDFLASYLR